MAAAKLVTRCPACRTAFRLVADQLRLRQGLVRCGQCDTVFDAREHLIEVPAPAATSDRATPAAPKPVASPAAVTMAAALAHAEQTQATAREREHEAPFDPGFDPGYEVPALDSPTTMMSEPEAEARATTETEAPAAVVPDAEAEAGTGVDAATEPEAPAQAEAAEPATEAPHIEALEVEAPDVETPPAAPSAPWPTLNHSAFEDTPRPGHSSLDPAAALAPKNPGEIPPSGAYSAKATWPPLKPTEASHRPVASVPAEVPTEVAAEANTSAADALPVPNPFPPTEPVRSASEYLRTADPADPEADAWAAQAKIDVDPDTASHIGTPDAIARETTTRHWLRRDTASPATGPVFAPDFLRHTRAREQARGTKPPAPRAPGSRRVWMRAAVVILGLGVLAQGAYLARSQIAGNFPVLRPVLEAACASVGCDVPPWRDLDALRIDSSQLQKQDESGDVYQLAVTLRNQGRATTALPAIELVMTDLQDQLLLRRVLPPAEYLEPAQRGFATSGLRAGSELPVRVRFRTQQAAANYRVLIFYP